MIHNPLDLVDKRNKLYRLGVDLNIPNQFALPKDSYIRELLRQLIPSASPRFLGTSSSTSVSANSTQVVVLRIPQEVVFVWTALVANPSISTLSIKIINPSNGIEFMKSAVPSTIIAGVGARPYYLTTPTIFYPNTDIILELTNTGGSAITPNVTLLGHAIFINQLTGEASKVLADRSVPLAYHYWYLTDTYPLTITTTITEFTTSIAKDGDFIAQQLVAGYTADFFVDMWQVRNGRDIIRNGVGSGVFGSGEYNPFLAYPLYLPRGEQLVWSLSVSSGTSTARLILGGIFVPAGIADFYERRGV